MFGHCFVAQCFVSFLVLQSSRLEKELVALLVSSSGSYAAVIVRCLFLTVPRIGMWCVIVAFPGHTCFSWFQT